MSKNMHNRTLLLIATAVSILVYARSSFIASTYHGPQNKQNGKYMRHRRLSLLTNDDTVDVVIIGAGWAGLAAAHELQANRVKNIKILEARDYVGGRSVTSNEMGIPVDLGSAWIQGTRKNPIMKIATDLNVTTYDEALKGYAVYDYEGSRLKSDEIQVIWGYFYGFMDYMTKKQNTNPVDVSLQSTLDEYILEKNIPDGVEGKLGLDMALESDIELEHAAPLSAMSLWWWDNAQWYAGGDAFLGVPGGGFTRIVEGYAEPLMPFIELRSKVTQINTTGEITQVTYTDERTNETNVILAKKVLVTVPIGVLQSGAIQFIPQLPTEKLNSIGNLGNGVMEKCFLHWEEDIDIFWPKKKEWLMKVAKTEAEQGNWTMFHNAYEVNGGKAILAGYVVGDAAKRVGTMTDDQVVKEALESLREMFGADKVPDPKDSLVTRWGTDEFSMGAYSFQKVGSDFYDDRNNIMKQVDDKVWFAGEATSVKYPSTTHGALLSGIEAAQNILSN